jgi:hypothetical protein
MVGGICTSFILREVMVEERSLVHSRSFKKL